MSFVETLAVSVIVGGVIVTSLPDVVVYNKYPVYFKEQQGYHRDAAEFWVYGNDRPDTPNETRLERTPDTGMG